MLRELTTSIPKYIIDDVAHPATWKHATIDEATQFYDVRIHIWLEAALTFPTLARNLRNPPIGCRIPESYVERMHVPLSTSEFWTATSLGSAEG